MLRIVAAKAAVKFHDRRALQAVYVRSFAIALDYAQHLSGEVVRQGRAPKTNVFSAS